MIAGVSSCSVCGPWVFACVGWCDVLQFIVHIVQLFILLPTGAVDTSTDYHDLASCSDLLHNDNSILQRHSKYAKTCRGKLLILV